VNLPFAMMLSHHNHEKIALTSYWWACGRLIFEPSSLRLFYIVTPSETKKYGRLGVMLSIWHQIMGGTLVLAGIIVLPMPLPFGLPMLAIGLSLLAPYLPPVQALVRYLRKRSKPLDSQMVKWRDRAPPVIQKTIDKTKP
jgi:hypothetical protein